MELEKVITSRKTIAIKKEEGWFSESEMKTDLKWSQSLRYIYTRNLSITIF